MSTALVAFYELDFPQYQIPPMPDSMIFNRFIIIRTLRLLPLIYGITTLSRYDSNFEASESHKQICLFLKRESISVVIPVLSDMALAIRPLAIIAHSFSLNSFWFMLPP